MTFPISKDPPPSPPCAPGRQAPVAAGSPSSPAPVAVARRGGASTVGGALAALLALLAAAPLPAQTDWIRAPVLGSRFGHTMAYDVARERVVLYVGEETWLYGEFVPATAQTIGSPCTGTNGPPRIASSVPFVGNQGLVRDLVSARASTPCLFGLSPRTQNLQLGGGCTLYLGDPMVFLFTATNASGFASTKLAVPLDLALRGAAVSAQGVAADPMGGFGGLSFSAG